MHSKEHHESQQAIKERMNEIADDKLSLMNTAEGENLSFDDMADIYIQAMGEHRNKNNFSLTTRSKTGEINDYLEVRRPFGAAQWVWPFRLISYS